ncbi:hypothetical protein OPU71_21055 [Niveibacterium sp. 24ML]|uniref:hypothetical protein n=1 Tax=Niveibacterium sp. 24ML TaxID=2985512 RepID=UPI0022714F09|nr:hypothetical protein [Niveibacterium sp. 24ML]MCX9158610.1 hypothetical protein [Niveibacterium sp. 24ML]
MSHLSNKLPYAQNIVLGAICALMLLSFGASLLQSALASAASFGLHSPIPRAALHFGLIGVAVLSMGFAFLLFAAAKFCRRHHTLLGKHADGLRLVAIWLSVASLAFAMAWVLANVYFMVLPL